MSYENFTLMSWNIIGINNTIAKRNMRYTIAKEKPWVIFIQETKCGTLPTHIHEGIWDDSHDWSFAEALGQSGGLATSWDDKVLKLITSTVNNNRIWCKWELRDGSRLGGKKINGINVYGP